MATEVVRLPPMLKVRKFFTFSICFAWIAFFRSRFAAFRQCAHRRGDETPRLAVISPRTERQSPLSTGTLFDDTREQWKVDCQIF